MNAPVNAPARRGRAGLMMLLDTAAPIGLYYLLHGLGVDTFPALLISAVVPGLSALVQIVRHRRLDSLAAFVVGITVLSAGASLISGSPRFLLAKDGWVTGIGGIWLLISTARTRPVVFYFARALLEGRVGPAAESWDYLWDRLPGFRRVWRVASVIWGVATIGDAALRFVMAYTMPVNSVPGLNGVQYAVLFLVLQVITNVYYRRAGLYDPWSWLYAPIRPPAQAAGEPQPEVESKGERT